LPDFEHVLKLSLSHSFFFTDLGYSNQKWYPICELLLGWFRSRNSRFGILFVFRL